MDDQDSWIIDVGYDVTTFEPPQVCSMSTNTTYFVTFALYGKLRPGYHIIMRGPEPKLFFICPLFSNYRCVENKLKLLVMMKSFHCLIYCTSETVEEMLSTFQLNDNVELKFYIGIHEAAKSRTILANRPHFCPRTGDSAAYAPPK